jgi:DNA polymerase III epsilon subunit-like protein
MFSQVIGVNQIETERKRRSRRRRRPRKSAAADVGGCDDDMDDDHHSMDDGTCSTASLSSESTSSSSSLSGSSSATIHDKKQHQQQVSRRQKQSKRKQQRQREQRQDEISTEEQRRYVALDCEMVGVGPHGNRSSVAKVTLVAMDGSVLLDDFVQQDEAVYDYRTFVSGVTARDLEAAPWTLDECRTRVLDLIGGKVLIGHALKNDLRALCITHPWYLTRDTAKFEPFMQTRFEDGILWPRKLKDLVKEKLDRDIQLPGVPHSAYEDAVAAMDLYRTVRRKWEKVMDYKLQKTIEIETKTCTL